jgi:hypothetical protein
MARIQYASKLFINKRPVAQVLKPSAPILALLGDIGSPFCEKTRKFIEWTTNHWDMVMWVPGVEEWSTDDSTTMLDVPGAMKSVSSKRLAIMNNNSWLYKTRETEILFLGTTLWGPCRISKDKNSEFFYKNTSELNKLVYRPIDAESSRHMQPKQIEAANKKAVKWLAYQIDDSRDEDKTRPIVVLSYTTPSHEGLSNEDKFNLPRLPMRNNLDCLMNKPVHSWLYGDVSRNVSTMTNKGIYLSSNSALCKNGFGPHWTTEVRMTQDSWYPPVRTSTLLSTAPSLALPFDE